MSPIENTSKSAKETPENFLFQAIALGSGSAAIEHQEAQGQAQLVDSDRLPTDLHSSRGRALSEPGDAVRELTSLGFTVGNIDCDDQLFRKITLPDGWKREAADHAMWSYIVDQLGRRRVMIFYKAAFYDRKAHALISSLRTYVNECVSEGRPVVFCDTWATRKDVAEIAVKMIFECNESIDRWMSAKHTGKDYVEKYVNDDKERREKYIKLMEDCARGNG